ncbi:2-oxoglutarate (2OG) and Fe(II)-dependent oxygenase superfamily protein [Quillaja saponaria]|uniref:2-oxoglutarate (2OG) and Fe(II)-dependent oxygenase superfamily protein n=1 Tax=Quillaja saponaria TaxID=32244 RepID=A0AAD7L9Q4_QUISA|nr:2-oxoglutarate (2OG) and Fe(II)-dependent oxygenase superfamily protein [Quillaja saponaria]
MEVGGSTLDSHHGFIVEYGTDRDVDLVLHGGRHQHGARPVTSGHLINLFLWCRRIVFLWLAFAHYSMENLNQSVELSIKN